MGLLPALQDLESCEVNAAQNHSVTGGCLTKEISYVRMLVVAALLWVLPAASLAQTTNLTVKTKDGRVLAEGATYTQPQGMNLMFIVKGEIRKFPAAELDPKLLETLKLDMDKLEKQAAAVEKGKAEYEKFRAAQRKSALDRQSIEQRLQRERATNEAKFMRPPPPSGPTSSMDAPGHWAPPDHSQSSSSIPSRSSSSSPGQGSQQGQPSTYQVPPNSANVRQPTSAPNAGPGDTRGSPSSTMTRPNSPGSMSTTPPGRAPMSAGNPPPGGPGPGGLGRPSAYRPARPNPPATPMSGSSGRPMSGTSANRVSGASVRPMSGSTIKPMSGPSVMPMRTNLPSR